MSAAEAVAALGTVTGAVDVVGTGLLADEVRHMLRDRGEPVTPPASPAAIIETTGELAELVAALERVDDLGTVVLAGPDQSGPVPLDLYAELHVRGLTVVGVAHGRPDLTRAGPWSA